MLLSGFFSPLNEGSTQDLSQGGERLPYLSQDPEQLEVLSGGLLTPRSSYSPNLGNIGYSVREGLKGKVDRKTECKRTEKVVNWTSFYSFAEIHKC